MSKKVKAIIAIVVCSVVVAAAIPLIILGVKKSSNKGKRVETISLQNCVLLDDGTYEKNVNVNDKFTISYTISPEDAKNKDVKIEIYKTSVVSSSFDVVKNDLGGEVTFTAKEVKGEDNSTLIRFFSEDSEKVNTTLRVTVHKPATILSIPTFVENPFDNVKTITWNPVNTNTDNEAVANYNVKYKVIINNVDNGTTFEKIVDTNSFTFDESGEYALVKGCQYKVKVVAVGNEYLYKDSGESSEFSFIKLDNIKNINISDGIISFDKVNYAQSYVVEYAENQKLYITTNTYNFATLNLNKYDLRVYSRRTNASASTEKAYEIMEISGTQVYVYDGDFSEKYTINKLSEISNIGLDNTLTDITQILGINVEAKANSYLKWELENFNEIKNYIYFELTFKSLSSKKEVVKTTSELSYKIDLSLLNELEVNYAQSIEVKVKAIIKNEYKAQFISSNEESKLNFYYDDFSAMTSQVSNNKLNLVVSDADNSKIGGFQLFFVNNGNVEVKDITTTTIELSEVVKDAGQYKVYLGVVGSIGNNGSYLNTVIDNPIAEFTKLRTIDINTLKIEESKNLVFKGIENISNYMFTFIDENNLSGTVNLTAKLVSNTVDEYYIDLTNVNELGSSTNIGDIIKNGILQNCEFELKISAIGNNADLINSAMSESATINRLATPSFEDIAIENNEISWVGEDNYTYAISFDNGLTYRNIGTVTSFDINTIKEEISALVGSVKVKVVATGIFGQNDKIIKSQELSRTFSRSATPSNIRTENGILKFDEILDATYELEFNGNTKTLTTNSYNFEEITNTNVTSVKIRSLVNNTFASDYSQEFFISKLPEVANVHLNDERTTISWDSVQNAIKYNVTIEDSDVEVNSNSYTFGALEVGIYNIKIMSVAKTDDMTGNTIDNPAYISSNLYEYSVIKMASPTNVKVENGEINWEYAYNQGVEVSNFVVTLTTDGETPITTTTNAYALNVDALIAEWDADAEINISVIAVSNNGNTIQSNSSTIYTTKKLLVPTVSVNENGLIEITSISSQPQNIKYIVEIYDAEDKLVNTKELTQTEFNLSDEEIEGASYLKVKATNSSYFTSDLSEKLEINKLEKVTGFSVDNDNNTLTFNKVENTSKYSVLIKKGDTVILQEELDANSDIYDSNDSNKVIIPINQNWVSGNYTITVTNNGSSQYLTSDAYLDSFAKLTTPSFETKFIVNNILTWKGESNYQYRIKIEKTDDSANSSYVNVGTANTYNFNTQEDFAELIANNQSVKVYIQAISGTRTNEIYSNVFNYTIEKTQKVSNLRVENGLFKFDKVEDSKISLRYSSGDTSDVDVALGTKNYYDFIGLTTNKTFYIKLIQMQDNQIYSEYTDYYYIQKLSSVTYVKSDATNRENITWDSVVNANHYSVKFNDAYYESSAITTNTFPFPVKVAGDYVIKVISVGSTTSIDTVNDSNNPAFISSDEFVSSAITKLSAPTNLKINNNILTWDYSQANNGGFYLSMLQWNTSNEYKDTLNSDARSFDASSYSANWDAAVTIQVQLKSLSNSDSCINSEFVSPSVQPEKLNNVSDVEIIDGVLNWANANTKGSDYNYLIKLYNSDKTEVINTITTTDTSYSFSGDDLSDVDYITITILCENYFNSNESNFFMLYKLAAVSGVTVDNINNILKFDKVDNAYSYIVTIWDSTHSKKSPNYTVELIDSNTEFNSLDYVFIDISKIQLTPSGNNYNISILTKGGDYNNLTTSTGYINSEEYLDIITKLPQQTIYVVNGDIQFNNYSGTYLSKYEKFILILNDGRTSNSFEFTSSDAVSGKFSLKSKLGGDSEYVDELSKYSGEVTLTLTTTTTEDDTLISDMYSKTVLKLQTPVLKVENGVLTWDILDENISSIVYIINSYDSEGNLLGITSETNNYHKFNSIYANTSYVKVQAQCSGLLFSEFSESVEIVKLHTVTDLKITRKNNSTEEYYDDYYQVTFNSVENATGYKVIIGGVTLSETLTTNSFDLPIDDKYTYGSHNIQIYAVGDNTKYINGGNSSILVYTILQTPKVEYINGYNRIQWNNVVNATKYELKLTDSQNNVNTVIVESNSTDQVYYYTGNELESETYKIQVKAIYEGESNILDSKSTSENTAVTMTKLESVTIRNENGKIVFDKVDENIYFRVYANESLQNSNNYTITKGEEYFTLEFVNTTADAEFNNVYIVCFRPGQYFDSEKSNTINAINLKSIEFTRDESGYLCVSTLLNGARELKYVISCEDINYLTTIFYDAEASKWKYDNDKLAEFDDGIIKIPTPNIEDAGKYQFNVEAIGSSIEDTYYLANLTSSISLIKANAPKMKENKEDYYCYDNSSSERGLGWAAYEQIDNEVLSGIELNFYIYDEVTQTYANSPTKTIQSNSTTTQYLLSRNSVLLPGKYKVTLQYLSDSNYVLNSNITVIDEITKLESPEVKIVNGVITWQQNGLSYVVRELFNGKSTPVTDKIVLEDGVYTYTDPSWLDDNNSYLIKVQAEDEKAISSDVTELVIYKLNEVTNFTRNDDGKLEFDGTLNGNTQVRYQVVCEDLNNFVIEIYYDEENSKWVYNYNGIQDVNYNSSTNKFSFGMPEIIEFGNYEFKIRAIGGSFKFNNGTEYITNYVNSNYTSLVITKYNVVKSDSKNFVVKNTQTNYGELGWLTYSSVTSETPAILNIKITKGIKEEGSDELTYTSTPVEINLSDFNVVRSYNLSGSEFESGNYKVEFTYISNNNLYLDSETVVTYIEKLDVIKPTITKGIITLNVLENEYDSFTVSDSFNIQDRVITTLNYENTSWLDGESYDIKFACHKDGYVSSSMSTTITVTKLKQISDFSLSFDNLQRFFNWTPEQDTKLNYIASAFEITCLYSGEEFEKYIIDSGNTSEYLIKSLPAGTYYYNIKAIGDTINYNSESMKGYVNSRISANLTIKYQKDVDSINIENGLVKWEKITRAEKYYVEVYVNSSISNLEILDTLVSAAKFYVTKTEFDINEIDAIVNSEEQNFIFMIRAITGFERNNYLVSTSTDEANNIGRFAKFDINDLYTDFRIDNGGYSYSITQDTLDLLNAYTSNFLGYEEITLEAIKEMIDSGTEYENKLAYNTASMLFNFEMEVNGENKLSTNVHYHEESETSIRILLLPFSESGTYSVRLRAIGNSNKINVENIETNDIPVFVRSNYTKLIHGYKPKAPLCPVSDNTEIVNNYLKWYPSKGYDNQNITSGYVIKIQENEDNFGYFYKVLTDDEKLSTSETLIQNILDFYDYEFSNEFKIEENKWYQIYLSTIGTDTIYKELENGVIIEQNNFDVLLTSTQISCGDFYIIAAPELEISDGDLRWQKDSNATAYEIKYGDTLVKLDIKTNEVYINEQLTEDTFTVDGNNYIKYSFRDKDYINGKVAVSVKAVGNGSNVLDSVSSSMEIIKLEQAEVKIANGRFEWKDNWNSENGTKPNTFKYVVQLIRYGEVEYRYNAFETTENYYELADNIPYADGSGNVYSYAIEVYLLGENSYLSSDSIKSTSAERLDTVGTLKATSYGRIEWNEPGGASDYVYKYEVYNSDGTSDSLLYTSVKANNYINLSDSKYSHGEYSLKIRAIPEASDNKHLNSVFNKTYNLVKYSTPSTKVDDKGLFSWNTSSYDATQQNEASMRLEIQTNHGFVVDGETSIIKTLIVELDKTQSTFDFSSSYKVTEYDNYYIIDDFGTKTLEFEIGVAYSVISTYMGYTGVLDSNTTDPYYLNSSSTFGSNVIKLDNVNIDESNTDTVVGEELQSIEGYESYNTYIMFTNKKYNNESITLYRFVINNKEYFINVEKQDNGMYKGEVVENDVTKLILLVNPNSVLAGSDVDVCYLIFSEDFVEYGIGYDIGIQAVKFGSNYVRSGVESIRVEVPQTPINLQYTGYGLIVWYGTSNSVKYNVEYSYTTNGVTYKTVNKQVDGSNYVNTTTYNGEEVFVYTARVDEITAENGIEYIKVNSVSTINSSYVSPYVELNETNLEYTLFDSGDGSVNNPYIIIDVQHLNNIKYNLTANYKLESDISISSSFIAIGVTNPWTSQGIDINLGNEFTGVFNGNGKTINYIVSNSFMSIATVNNKNLMSLFYRIGNSGTVQDIKIYYNNGTATYSTSGTFYMSSIAYENNGTIKNIFVDGSINIKNNYSFYYAVVTENNGKIESIVNNANITISERTISKESGTIRYLAIAGIVTNNNSNGTIVNCGNNGTLTASVIGGIVTNNYGNVSSCYNKGNFNITDFEDRRIGSVYSGGLITIYYGGSITFCYSNNSVKYTINTSTNKSVYIGGLISTTGSETSQTNNKLTNSYAVLTVSNTQSNNISIKRGNIIALNNILTSVSRIFADTSNDIVGTDSIKKFNATNLTSLKATNINGDSSTYSYVDVEGGYPILEWETTYSNYWNL